MSELQVGMSSKQVFELAKNLPQNQQKNIAMFFRNDKDGVVSHENELAILNSFFDGSGKVKMPQTSDVINPANYNASHCMTKNTDGTTSYSILYDMDNDGYADGHNMGEYTVNGRISTGWHGKDNNLDGVAERKGIFRANLNNVCDPNNIDPDLDSTTLQDEVRKLTKNWKSVDITV